MDFAENYTCLSQDEIQSAHWRQAQISLYTVMVYNGQNTWSWILVSDIKDHEKKAVTAYTSIVLDKIEMTFHMLKRYIFGLMVIVDSSRTSLYSAFVPTLLRCTDMR
jgi:hypothetical protein